MSSGKKDERVESFSQHLDAKKQHAVDRVVSDIRHDLERERAKYKELLHDYEGVMQKLELVSKIDETGTHPRPIEPMSKDGTGEATALMMLSDVHPYARVRPETIGGLNKHTPQISEMRQRNFWRGGMNLVEIERSGQNIPRLLVFLGGDLLGNILHPDAIETNYGTPQQELLFELERLQEGLDFCWENGKFKEIRVICCHGNHDRDTKFKQYENQALHAHTWVLYHILKRDYERRNKKEGWNVQFDIAEGYHSVLPIYGRKIRFHHGDAVFYQGGVGGPTIPINKAIDKWNTGGAVDLDIFGHWHMTMSDSRFFCNGSVVGYSAYSLERKFPYEVPRQWFLLLDQKRWVTSQRYIYLD